MPSVFIVVKVLPAGGGQVWSGNYFTSREAAERYIASQTDSHSLLPMELMEWKG